MAENNTETVSNGGQQQPMLVPPAAQPNQQYAYAIPVQQYPKQSSAEIFTRVGLTAVSLLWDIIWIALASVLLGQGWMYSVSLFAFGAAIPSAIWNIAELITYCVRMRSKIQRGIHPGAHVALHLLFWLVGVLGIFSSVLAYTSLEEEIVQCRDQDEDRLEFSLFCGDYPFFHSGRLMSVFRAFIALLVLWVVTHFVLFVLACIDTHKRNTFKSAAVVAYTIVPDSTMATVPGMFVPQQAGMSPVQLIQPASGHAIGAQSQSPAPVPMQQTQELAGYYAPASEPTPAKAPASTTVTTTSPV